MIFGSLIPSAKAITEPTTNSNANAQIREIFIEVFLFNKGILLGTFLPALGECGEVSSSSGAGQAVISDSKNILGDPANCCAQPSWPVQIYARPFTTEHLATHKKAGARKPRLSSWSCARIKT